MTSRFILKQLDYLLSVSMHDSWQGHNAMISRANMILNQSAHIFSLGCFEKCFGS